MDESIESQLNINSVLPPEMLGQIFSLLTPKDLKTVMLVCKSWRDVGERPALWSWVEITKLSQLRLKRLQGAREIIIDESLADCSWLELFQAVLRHPGLKKVKWEITLPAWMYKIKQSEKDLLPEIFSKMEDIHIHGADKDLAELVANAILKRSKNVKSLYLGFLWGPDGPDVELVVSALNKIETVEAGLRQNEANLLLKKMLEGTSIKSLSFNTGLLLSEIEPSHLFGSFQKIKRLELLGLEDKVLEKNLVATLCEAIMASNNLKDLKLCGVHLCRISHHLLEKTAIHIANHLEVLHLDGSYYKEDMKDQIGAIVRAIVSSEGGCLKILDLNCINFSLIESDLLAKMVKQVELVRFTSDLDEDQMFAILKAIADEPGKLQKLFLTVSTELVIDTDTLGAAANNLETLELYSETESESDSSSDIDSLSEIGSD